MIAYTPSTNFAVKDALSSGDPLKVVRGTEINTEFVNISTAVTSINNKLTVSVKDFGAVGDGVTDDTVAIQAALTSGAGTVFFSDGTYKTTDTLFVNTSNQQIQLSPKSTISLDTSTNTHRVFDAQASDVVIDGGEITTTYRDLDFLVKLTGANCTLQNSILYFASKSTNAAMVFNQGGVELQGDCGEVSGCEIYNQDGQGVAIYGDDCSVLNNKLHDNITGVWGAFGITETVTKHCLISGNFIYDNNVNNDDGADGILVNGYDGSCIVTSNTISNSGEHGMYIRAYSSVIANNIVYESFASGIKIRDQINSSVVGNICCDNATGGASNAEIYCQASEINSNNILISGNNVKASGANHSIRVAYTSAVPTLTRLTVSNNSCVGDMSISGNSDVTISNNDVNGILTAASAFTFDPTTQLNFKVENNRCSSLNVERAHSSAFNNNICANLSIQASNTLRNNSFNGNIFTNQTGQISRGQFNVFNNNIVTCTSLTLPLFLQASTSAVNSNKQIVGNKFTGLTVRLIDDTTSGISGNYNIISNNIFDTATDAFSFFGVGHSVMGNVNTTSGGSMAFVGCSNSWLIGNSPIATLRSGTVGNVLL